MVNVVKPVVRAPLVVDQNPGVLFLKLLENLFIFLRRPDRCFGQQEKRPRKQRHLLAKTAISVVVDGQSRSRRTADEVPQNEEGQTDSQQGQGTKIQPKALLYQPQKPRGDRSDGPSARGRSAGTAREFTSQVCASMISEPVACNAVNRFG